MILFDVTNHLLINHYANLLTLNRNQKKKNLKNDRNVEMFVTIVEKKKNMKKIL